jgi:hypothetical protein
MYEQVAVFLYSIRRNSSFTLSSCGQATKWGRGNVQTGRSNTRFRAATPYLAVITTFAY